MCFSGKWSLILAVVILLVTAVSSFAEEKVENVENPVVLMKTSLGDIKIELDAEKAPISVKNFLGYVTNKHYDGTIFHRVIEGFMIQGGGYNADLSYKPTTYPSIKNEARNGLKNMRGTIAMARTNDINSATSQFFINVVDNAFLDYQDDKRYGYAVFGKVIEGMEVVDKIRVVKTGSKGSFPTDAPQENVIIISVTKIK